MKPNYIYSLESIPSYTCPLCCRGKMEPDFQSCLSRPTGESVALLNSSQWEESFHKEMLRLDLSCSNNECREVGILVMEGELSAPSEHQTEAEVLYRPTYIYPAPSLFQLETEYPEKIRSLMKEAFSLFWSDPASCGNKVRVGVEALLNDQKIDSVRKEKSGVPKLGKKGRPMPIQLQNRLDIFKKKGAAERASAAALESIKWLGNESSHAGMQIHSDIVYRAVMIFGSVLAYLYRNEPLPSELDYSVSRINFWYHPEEQDSWPTEA